MLLKPLDQARADGDHIYGVIKASAINHGRQDQRLHGAESGGARRSDRAALRQAGVDARTISYVEAHGTGTGAGRSHRDHGADARVCGSTEDKQYCAIGSAKSNIGHCESAAGIAGVTKVLLQMQHGQLAPSLHAETLNPNIDFAKTPFVVQRELSEWPRPEGHPRRAGISSFGAGGSNAHLVIEEFVDTRSPVVASGPVMVVLSAKNEERLKEQAAAIGGCARQVRGSGPGADRLHAAGGS